MRYYAQYEETGILIAVGTGVGGEEITETEYNSILTDIKQKAVLIDRIINEEISIDAVPAGQREEVQRRVDARIAQQGAAEELDLSADEVLDIILGGAT